VSLSTIGSSNRKGALQFAAAALGGLMGLAALVYAFPNADGLGGFWPVFGAGTAVAAWINFGSPRVSMAGTRPVQGSVLLRVRGRYHEPLLNQAESAVLST
jgi:hypothetical protein